MSLKLRGIEYVYNCKWVLACCWFMSFGCVPKLGTWLLSFCKLKSAGPNQGHNLFEVTWSSVMQLRVPIKDRPCHSMLIRNFEGKHPFIGRLQAFLNSHEIRWYFCCQVFMTGGLGLNSEVNLFRLYLLLAWAEILHPFAWSKSARRRSAATQLAGCCVCQNSGLLEVSNTHAGVTIAQASGSSLRFLKRFMEEKVKTWVIHLDLQSRFRLVSVFTANQLSSSAEFSSGSSCAEKRLAVAVEVINSCTVYDSNIATFRPVEGSA